MKKSLLLSVGIGLMLGQASSRAQQVYSWENTVDGWGILQANWTDGGYSTTTGVTSGTYSWILNAAAGPDYGAALGGTATTGLTALLANAASVSVDVYATGFSYMQWDLTLNQGGGLGYQSTDGYSYSQSPSIGSQSTLTFTIPASMRTTLAANLGLPTSLNFQIGGGNAGTVYLDNLVIHQIPEPGSFALLGLGSVALLRTLRRRG